LSLSRRVPKGAAFGRGVAARLNTGEKVIRNFLKLFAGSLFVFFFPGPGIWTTA
jgi:hypothetical protein